MSCTKYVDIPVTFTACWTWNMHFIQSTLLTIANNTQVVVLPQDRLPVNITSWAKDWTFLLHISLHLWTTYYMNYHQIFMNTYIALWITQLFVHPTSKPIRKFWKVSCSCWKNMACYSQSTKFTLSDLRSNIWDCYFPAKIIYMGATITPLGSCVKATSNPTDTSDSAGY